DDATREAYIDRICAYMEKALHEAKVNLSWINPDPEYVAAVRTFIRRSLSSGARGRAGFFLKDVPELRPSASFFGAIKSLAQALLKLTAPGVPDIYQGSEGLAFRLVDPDNRRKIDFAAQQRAFQGLEPQSVQEQHSLCAQMLALIGDGRAKLWTTMCALRFR